MASNCKSFKREIEDAGRKVALSVRAQRHLEECRACLSFFGESDRLRRLVGDLERVEAPGDFEFRLRARIAAAQGARPRPISFLRFTPGLASVSLAVLFAISIAAALYLRRETPVSDADVSQVPSPAAIGTSASLNEVMPDQRTNSAPMSDEVAAVLEGGATAKTQPRRVAPDRFFKARPRSRGLAADNVLEFGLRATPIVSGPNVRIKVSAEPLSMVLRDESGSTRRVRMKPVSFGAQNLVSRAREVPRELVANNEGVW